MDEDPFASRTKGDGLEPKGPFSKAIPTFKVAFRPQDRMLGEKVRNLSVRLAGEGIPIPVGSFASVRTMEGFCHFPDLSDLVKNMERAQRSFCVIDYDPLRRSFCINGEGEGSIALEISWYSLEAFPGDVLVLGFPVKDAPRTDVPDTNEERVQFYISTLRSWKASRKAVSMGYELYRFQDLKIDAARLSDPDGWNAGR